MGLDVSPILTAAFTAVVPAVVGWLTLRAIKGIDAAISTLNDKVDHLSEQDAKFGIELAELRVRVTHLEFLVQGGAHKK